MRISAIVPTLVLASTATAISDFQWAAKCGAKNPHVNTAIQKFCGKNDIVVPSNYANIGKVHEGFHVAIGGRCIPPQWVPSDWCYYQLSKLCANGNKQGLGHNRYGRNRCQEWHIDRRKM